MCVCVCKGEDLGVRRERFLAPQVGENMLVSEARIWPPFFWKIKMTKYEFYLKKKLNIWLLFIFWGWLEMNRAQESLRCWKVLLDVIFYREDQVNLTNKAFSIYLYLFPFFHIQSLHLQVLLRGGHWCCSFTRPTMELRNTPSFFTSPRGDSLIFVCTILTFQLILFLWISRHHHIVVAHWFSWDDGQP